MLEGIVNPIFAPLLHLQPWASLTIISFIISMIIIVVYKFATDQDLMKRLKTEIKEFQKELKELKGHPEKAMAVNKKAMETNMKYMMHSMKPTLITFLPIIIIFGWLNANLAFEPILPNHEFTVTAMFDKIYTGNATLSVPEGLTLISDATQQLPNSQVSWTLKGKEGDYLVEISTPSNTYTKDIKIAATRAYAPVIQKYREGPLKTAKISNDTVRPFKNLSIFGWRPGWLGTYIILSILFSTILRKLFKVY